ncbi:MAG: RluA family pseudouridine synthase [Treponema sp.]|jgi:RluA family pseudouridine synthase|nr:RluA family pseudouridine synthase [Treponema sp.]
MRRDSLQELEIIYQDASLIAINKPSGVSVGGDRWDEGAERLDKILEARLGRRMWTVHRIDKETSGVVVFAKDADAHRLLSMAFEEHMVKKCYVAAVYGAPIWRETVCDLPLTPNGNKKHLTIIDRYQGKKSITRFKVKSAVDVFSILEVFPETGRTHQIRVHASALGHPVVCDSLYCRNPKPIMLSSFKRGWRGDLFDEKPLLARLGLHALEITLPDGLTFQAPYPRDMKALIAQIEKTAK